jgi:hypothetical protein
MPYTTRSHRPASITRAPVSGVGSLGSGRIRPSIAVANKRAGPTPGGPWGTCFNGPCGDFNLFGLSTGKSVPHSPTISTSVDKCQFADDAVATSREGHRRQAGDYSPHYGRWLSLLLSCSKTGGENDRLGAGPYHGPRCRLRHSRSAVGPETPSTKIETARAGPFHQRDNVITLD